MPNADRAAVAREVLTEMLNYDMARVETIRDVQQFMNEHYPAPPAPETVTVTFRDGSTETLSLRDGQWQSGTGLLYDELMVRACLDRIASDARVTQERDARIAELEVELHETRERQLPMVRLRDEAYRQRDAARARIAELETQLQRALDGAVFHEKRAHHAEQERDAALRALEEKGQQERLAAVAPSPKASGDTQGSPPAPVVPAPIPLGAVLEVEGDPDSPYERVSGGWIRECTPRATRVQRLEKVYRDDDVAWGNILTRYYHARHPVATRETVERVRKALFQAFRATRVEEDFTENCTRAALTAAGFTLEGGA